MINQITDHTQYLYHYTKAETATEHILPSMQLRLSPLQEMNDPRDAIARRFSVSNNTRAPDFDHETLNAQLNARIVTPCKIASFSTDTPRAVLIKDHDGPDTDPIDALHERGWARPRMWSQYADDHKGVCLIFDRERIEHAVRSHLNNDIVMIESGPVLYENARLQRLGADEPLSIHIDQFSSIGFDRAADAHAKRFSRALFFEKNTDWQAEREYRILVRDTSITDQYVYIPINTALVGIVYGSEISRSNLFEIAKLVLDCHVKIAEARWQNGIPQITPDHPRALMERIQHEISD